MRSVETAFGPILVAETFLERLRGIRAVGDSTLLAIPGRSVHGFGLEGPLRVVGIGPDGSVVGIRRLRPGRIVTIAGARWMLETPADVAVPAPGDRLVLG